MPREAHICNTPKCDNNATRVCKLCTQDVCEKHNYIVTSICTVDIVHNVKTARLAERIAKSLVDLGASFSICSVCAELLYKTQIQRDFRENTVSPAVLALFATWPAAVQQTFARAALTENNEKDTP